MVYDNHMLLGFYFREHYLLPNLSQKWARANCKKELPSKKQLNLLKVSKMTINFFDMFKVAVITLMQNI